MFAFLLTTFFEIALCEIIHIWTVAVDESEEWSSQLIFQFKQLERKSLKKSGLQRDSNLTHDLRDTGAMICSTNWAMKPHGIGSEVNLLFHIYFTSFHSSREIWTQQIDLAPNVWLHSSVGRASHRYSQRSWVQIPLKSWFFFRLLLSRTNVDLEKSRVPDGIWTHEPPWSSRMLYHWATGDSVVSKGQLTGTASRGSLTASHCHI